MTNKLIFLTCSILAVSFTAHAAQLCGKAMQGEILVGRAPGVQSVIYDKLNYPVAPDGTFLLAFGRDAPSDARLTLVQKDKTMLQAALTVTPAKWDIQRIKGIPPRKVTPSDSDLRDIEREQKLVRGALRDISAFPYWAEGFVLPVKGRISGHFGGQRIMNKIPKNPHAGMDIAVPEGTPVGAAAAGIVVLAEKDLFYSGNVVILDHGYGLHTIYAHLKDINVKPGNNVVQGETIGTAGQTGRATGPHLHWGASLNSIKFNPQSLLNINTFDDFCFNL